MSAAQPVADVDATKFVAVSQASKEALKTANLLRTLQVSALIRGESGVGRKTLASYILPSAPVVDAKNHEELLSVLHSSAEVIVSNLENVANIKVVLQEARENRTRIIATASPLYEDEILSDFFGIDFTIPPLRDRMEDVAMLIERFKEETVEMLGRDFSLDMKKIEPNLSENALSLKRQIIIRATFDDVEEEDLMELLQDYLYERLGGNDDYRKFLHLYEVPLIKAGLKRFKSQLQLSQILGLNRNTLRKKISNIKEYLHE